MSRLFPSGTRLRGVALLGGLVAAVVLCSMGCGDPEAATCAWLQATADADDRMDDWDQRNPETRALLERFRPRIFIAPGSYRPMSFYEDYLPKTRWRGRRAGHLALDGIPVAEDLQRVQQEEGVYLDYTVEPKDALRFTGEDVSATAYGRVYDATHEGEPRRFLFLKYSFVFPYSGLPAGNGWVKRNGSELLGDAEAWHELDIHGAIHVVLDASTRNAIGVLLAQHNHHRLHLVGRDMCWPDDNRVAVSFAAMSNEPYLLPVDEEYARHRVVGDPMQIEYLVGRSDKGPVGSGEDVVYSEAAGASEVDYAIELLPIDDPLFTAWICLGDKQRVLGLWKTWFRQGPPGMDFYTLPEVLNLVDLAAFWDIDPDDDDLFRIWNDSVHGLSDYDLEPVLQHQLRRFQKTLANLESPAKN